MAEVRLKEQIEKLIGLQNIDTQIYNLEIEKKAKPEEIKQLDQALEEKKKCLTDKEKALLDLQKKRKEHELDLATKEEGIKKNQNQLYQLKTNKEYSAMLKEIDGIKADISLIEDKIIEVLEQVDGAKAAIEQEKQNLKEEEKKIDADKNIIQIKVKEIDDKLAQLKTKREQTIPDIDSKILKQYERISKGRDSLAIVPVKNNSCQGCFMNVPPQVINLIKMYDRLVVCEVCQRILYIQEDEEA